MAIYDVDLANQKEFAMSNAVQMAELRGMNNLGSQTTKFVTTLARKASLVNIIDATTAGSLDSFCVVALLGPQS
jgi:hypothetical protein